jgi:hypothetical protein
VLSNLGSKPAEASVIYLTQVSHMLVESNQILVKQVPTHIQQQAKVAKTGHCPVVEHFFPDMAVCSIGTQGASKSLNKIDPYMLEEVGLVLDKVLTGLRLTAGQNHAEFNIVLKQQALVLNGGRDLSLILSRGQIRSMNGMLGWLVPNFIALTRSQEYLDFSQYYAINQHHAIRKYAYLGFDNQHKCKLVGKINSGQIALSWWVESPLHQYCIESKVLKLSQ